MSLEKIQKVFENISDYDGWSLQLLRIKTSKRDGTTYTGREVELTPLGSLSSLVKEIGHRYSLGKHKIGNQYESITDYDGSTVNNTIYKLMTDSELIEADCTNLLSAIASPDSEIEPLDFDATAYIIRGKVKLDGEELPVKLITMQCPITTLKHKYWGKFGKFEEISDKVLSLKTSVDVLMLDKTIYMLTLAGENLFNLERAYRATCSSKVADIQECDIVSDIDAFSSIATTGHNPRKFISFNDAHLQKLKNVKSRQKISKKFGIPLDSKNKFDMSKADSADKLVKVLCDRGMVDPFDELPMEVAGSKKWEV